MRIDAHQHFWRYDSADYGWISDEMALLRRDFLPADLLPQLQRHQLDGCIAVQARQSLEETRWLLQLADEHDFIKGVVGWIDLCADDLEQQLDQFADETKLKGFRHVLQDEAADFMLQPQFIRGLHTLAERGYCYDLLVFSDQLPQLCQLVSQLPVMPLVIDHIAKPDIKAGEIGCWHNSMAELAAHEHIYCKVSGMVTEADWQQWQPEQFTPYLQRVLQSFGPARLMFGSDWPVCQLAASYEQLIELLLPWLDAFDPIQRSAFMGGNARRFYKLK